MEKQIEIVRSVTEISMSHRSFSLRPVFLDTLYKKHDTSLVYLAVGGDVDALQELQSSLARSLTDLKISQPDKFRPHIVIGKLKKMDPVMTKDVLQKIQDVDIDPLPEFTVNHICLYESFLTREGSHYRRIGRYMLQ